MTSKNRRHRSNVIAVEISSLLALSKRDFTEANALFPELYDLMFGHIDDSAENSKRDANDPRRRQNIDAATSTSTTGIVGRDEYSKHISLLQSVAELKAERRCFNEQIDMLSRLVEAKAV